MLEVLNLSKFIWYSFSGLWDLYNKFVRMWSYTHFLNTGTKLHWDISIINQIVICTDGEMDILNFDIYLNTLPKKHMYIYIA